MEVGEEKRAGWRWVRHREWNERWVRYREWSER